jgi:Acyl-coenzyme A synthetases/AMP-(fatty) acid ligases
VREGDRVALFLPMSPAVAVASHACAHIGAVQVPVFSGFAAPAIAARLEDSEAKAVICADWSYRRGKRIDMLATLEQANDGGATVLTWGRESGWPELVTSSPERSSHCRSTRRRRISSPTRRARPAGPRARCTSRVASSFR